MDEKLPIKAGADYVRDASWQPRVMTRKQAIRYGLAAMPADLKRAGFECFVHRSDSDFRGGDDAGTWFRINYGKKVAA